MTEARDGLPEHDELRRQARLIDQMTSMHSQLRDRAVAISTLTTVALLAAAVVSLSFAFAGNERRVDIAGVTASRATWLGVLAILVLCGTVADLITDRRGVARRHDGAVRLLADLKAAYRQPSATNEPERETRLSDRYNSVMTQLPPIPEQKFTKLKARHLEKVEVSKILSANPGMSERQARAALKQRLDAGSGTPRA